MLGLGRSTTLLATAVLASSSAANAYAYQEVARPWRVTPERMIRTSPDASGAKSSATIESLGLAAVSFRADGSPALMWSTQAPRASVLSKAGAEENALAIAQSFAIEMGLDANDVYVLGSTVLGDESARALRIDPLIEISGFTTVTIGQRREGIEVPGGVMIFNYKNGQLAQIRNDLAILPATIDTARIDAHFATKLALREAKAFASDTTLVAPASLELWVPSDLAEDARLAYRVKTRSFAPRTELSIHVDAITGEVLAADDAVLHANGEGRILVTNDLVFGTSQAQFSGRYIALGGNAATDGDGEALQTAPVTITWRGPYAEVADQAGQQLEQFNVAFGGPYQVFTLTPTLFSQADPFTSINTAKAFARSYTPTMQWLGQRLTVNVNLNDTCNAYWDGTTVNFFRAGNGCNNTGRINTIVYHEFGHGYHQFLTQNVVGSVGEGTGDFYAASIANDPIVGRGFSTNGAGIRQIDRARVYPTDYVNEVHEDGLIWASALWEIRQAMIAKHGDWAGARMTTRMFILALSQGPGLSTAYPALIAGDDDDNNAANGTPNSCEMNPILQAHGLVNGGQINHTLAGTRAFVRINHDAPGVFMRGTEGVTITASAENRSTCGTFAMSDLVLKVAPGTTGGTFQTVPLTVNGNNASATYAGAAEGEVFRYYFELTAGGVKFSSGSETSPHVGYAARSGRADIMREGFENDFGTWTHGTVGSDQKDDWEVAAPIGLEFDPYAAHEGTKVAGTDLGSGGGPSGTDGIAKPGRHTYLESARILTSNMEDVRLEFWSHWAIAGNLKVLVDGQELYTFTNDGSAWSDGWRFVSIPLGDSARDNKSGITIRFEADSTANNRLGGWAIDSVAVTGVEIPPPPPPPPPPTPPPPTNPPPTNPPPPANPPPATPPPVNPPPAQGGNQDPLPQQPRPGASNLPFSGSVSGGCQCVTQPEGSFSAFALLALGLVFVLRSRKSLR